MGVNFLPRWTGHEPARLYRYGDQYKLQLRTTAEGRRDRAVPGSQGESSGEEKAAQAFSRARARVMELGLCNEWAHFVTLTLDPEKYDRFDLPRWRADLSQWLRNQRRLHCGDVRYLLIPEQHKDGAWHMHGLVAGIDPATLEFNEHGYLDWPAYRRRFGYISLSPVQSRTACARYISKYVSKDLASRASELGSHLYYASRGLKGRELVDMGDFSPPETLAPTYQTEYWWVLWLDSPLDLDHGLVDPFYGEGAHLG